MVADAVTADMAEAHGRIAGPAVTKAMKALEQLGIVQESSGRAWKRVFAYSSYLRIMTAGTERVSKGKDG
jgi:hypothetical protein